MIIMTKSTIEDDDDDDGNDRDKGHDNKNDDDGDGGDGDDDDDDDDDEGGGGGDEDEDVDNGHKVEGDYNNDYYDDAGRVVVRSDRAHLTSCERVLGLTAVLTPKLMITWNTNDEIQEARNSIRRGVLQPRLASCWLHSYTVPKSTHTIGGGGSWSAAISTKSDLFTTAYTKTKQIHSKSGSRHLSQKSR